MPDFVRTHRSHDDLLRVLLPAISPAQRLDPGSIGILQLIEQHNPLGALLSLSWIRKAFANLPAPADGLDLHPTQRSCLPRPRGSRDPDQPRCGVAVQPLRELLELVGASGHRPRAKSCTPCCRCLQRDVLLQGFSEATQGFGGLRRPSVGVGGEEAVDPVNDGGRVALGCGFPRRRPATQRLEQVGGVTIDQGMRWRPEHGLVEQRAEGIQITALGRCPTFDQLRRQILQGSSHARVLGRLALSDGEAKIEDHQAMALHRVPAGEQVRRLQITMDHPEIVCSRTKF